MKPTEVTEVSISKLGFSNCQGLRLVKFWTSLRSKQKQFLDKDRKKENYINSLKVYTLNLIVYN